MTNTMTHIIEAIDWVALSTQKNHLLNAIDGKPFDEQSLMGILHLIDAIQDAAVLDGFATEDEVFQ